MPHKRAKHSVRERRRSQSGLDLALGAQHSISNEAIPKSVARVLNAAKVQQEWAEKGRKRKNGECEEGRESPVKKKRRKDGGKPDGEHEDREKVEMRILPGETLAHFNRRVEDSMRPVVRDAIKSSSARMRKKRKEEETTKAGESSSKPLETKRRKQDDGLSATQEPSGKEKQPATERPKDFANLSSSAPRRLNDIVQAPPEIKILPRGAAKLAAAREAGQKTEEAKSLRQGALSMAQKAILEEERVRVVRLYRELKKSKAGG